ncbi:50S ribosomal protein L30 [Enterobacteriaceae bacterium ET-AT1-13]|nr:50S ribosomal protein L30 [Enterobacteriaceae bacterium ET-AT1-13]WGS66345.1 50S ribosomal protein L30 [Enterobacteriaceae bacterium Cmel17]WMC17368.1 MAG: 50S ribosomal protein L30 [Enterobacteriaceae bacterium Cmel21]WMC17575.1 MAG: 50S ribosomal protein L30 [Enterobacteriaceae bacterium PSmelAO3-2]WMC17780.1 MAG: 50S ribosomal protein L30 [Enterobacteriaceae bacterium PSmelAO3-1]WMC17983.1 MAG: 50S ribosomal protein L30 [Enterobacteriaceae bacterium PSmelAO1]
MYKIITIKQIRSSIGIKPTHKATLVSLGLGRINKVVKIRNTKSINGMIKLIYYMINIQD